VADPPADPCVTSVVFTTWSLPGSTREMLPAVPFTTQTEPDPTVSPVGVDVSEIFRSSESVCGSTRDTVLSSRFATQIESAPAATAEGRTPTATAPTTLFE